MANDKPYVLLVAGHRGTNVGGDDVERQLTDNLAEAYLKAFRADGYTTEVFQQVDGDSDDTMTTGSLATIARGCGRKLAARQEPLSIMLDLHFNTRESAVHAIVAHNRRQDGAGKLESKLAEGNDAGDVMENNGLDVRLAAAIAAEIARIPGMRLKGAGLSGIKGVMLENETRVGDPVEEDENDPPNSRLGMMAGTAPARMKAARITVEHGGTNDAKKPDFFNQCAQAALRAVNMTVIGRSIGGSAGPGVNGQATDVPAEALPAFLFGKVQDVEFNPDGPVSQLWLTTGNATGRFPRLTDVLVNAQVKHFVFSDGSVIVADGDAPVRHLTTLQA